jgi:S1-C subfamily serine protease
MLAALTVLVAVGIGIAIGYAAFHSTPPSATSPPVSPTTPAVSPSVAAKVDPGLVDIDTALAYQTATGAGTGMVVTSSGEVLTNNHVIEGETSLHVTDIGNGKTYPATVLGYDVAADVAVLQVTGASHLRTVSFAHAPARIGQAVVAIGNAGGKGGTPRAVSGTVTGLDQAVTARDELSGGVEHLTGMIQTDAPIEAGDSGGPLVDAGGKVLGMDTAGSSHFAFAQQTTEGFAIPIRTVRALAGKIERGEASSSVHVGPTAFLGVLVTNAGTTGAVVVEVLPGTTATAIGLAPGTRSCRSTVGRSGAPQHCPTRSWSSPRAPRWASAGRTGSGRPLRRRSRCRAAHPRDLRGDAWACVVARAPVPRPEVGAGPITCPRRCARGDVCVPAIPGRDARGRPRTGGSRRP